MNPVTTTTAVPTQVSTETPAPVRASPTTTTDTTPSQPADAIPSPNPGTTAPALTAAPAAPSQEATARLLKTAPKTNTDPAPTMGHKTRKGILYTTAFFVPPLAVYLKHGTNKHFGLNVLLTLLGWIPGVLHAMYHVSK